MRVDASMGEGGGQVLRSSLALSILTGTPLELDNIRARRNKPGLMRQHLTAVRAAATISNAEVEGDRLGSQQLRFRPGWVEAGEYGFAIGTAGSTNLVLQTILPPLLLAEGTSVIELEGGTHNEKAPSTDFLQHSFAPVLAAMGPRLDIQLVEWGFYPAGGGRSRATIQPGALQPIDLTETLSVQLHARAIVANVPRHVAQRELDVLRKRLDIPEANCSIEQVDSRGPGNVVQVEARHPLFTEVFTGFGKKGRRAEQVANSVADEVTAWASSGACVGEHLADQLLIPMALAGGGRFRTVAPSLHTLTNMQVIERFLDVSFTSEQRGDAWFIEVKHR